MHAEELVSKHAQVEELELRLAAALSGGGGPSSGGGAPF